MTRSTLAIDGMQSNGGANCNASAHKEFPHAMVGSLAVGVAATQYDEVQVASPEFTEPPNRMGFHVQFTPSLAGQMPLSRRCQPSTSIRTC